MNFANTEKCYYTRGVELISQERDGKKSYYVYDGHGSVRALADESGKVTDKYVYDAFGNLISSVGSTKNDFLFCGEQFDSVTGLYYLRARYMNPSVGRFITMDSYEGSIDAPVSLHKYLYANANPVMYSDPSGFLVAALPSPGEVMHMKSTVIIGRELLKALCTVGAAYVVSRISSELLATTALQVPNIAEYYRNVLVENAIGEIASNIKSLVLLRNIQIIYASLLHQVMTWASTKGKTNNDYNNKIARHHIVPKGMDETKFTRVILSLCGINCYSYSVLSPNIVVIKYSTHYALHSNNNLYVKTVNTVIFAAYSNSYNNSYLEQVASVHLALASLKGLISAIDLIIA